MNNLKELLKSEAGKPLKEFLIGHYLRLNNIDNVSDSGTPEEVAVDLKAAKKSNKMILNILEEIIDMEQSAEIKRKKEDLLYNL